MQITKEILEANGWQIDIPEWCFPTSASLRKDGWLAEWVFGRTSLSIWLCDSDDEVVDWDYELYIRNCETTEKLATAFKLCGIDYELKTE